MEAPLREVLCQPIQITLYEVGRDSPRGPLAPRLGKEQFTGEIKAGPAELRQAGAEVGDVRPGPAADVQRHPRPDTERLDEPCQMLGAPIGTAVLAQMVGKLTGILPESLLFRFGSRHGDLPSVSGAARWPRRPLASPLAKEVVGSPGWEH